MSLEKMMQTVMEDTAYLPLSNLVLTVKELTESETDEVIGFLAERPIHTIIMMGMIRDNGLTSEYNRGTFYGCRNSKGRLEGVALIGHATLIETRTRSAIREFAAVAQIHNRLNMFMAEQEKAEIFWNSYADDGQPMRVACRELLFELTESMESLSDVEGLRPATLDDLHLIASVHAAMAEEHSGVNPLKSDREGFLARCSRRITQNRIRVIVRENELIFKTDIQADTPEVVYLEGIYVCPNERGTGLGRRCLSKLTADLLTRSHSVCVLVSEVNEKAQAFYRMCGFRCVSRYDTIFLRTEPAKVLADK